MRTAFRSHTSPCTTGVAAGDLPVRDLNFDLKRLQKAHDDGSHSTRTARSYALAQTANTLHELGYRGLRANGLKGKSFEAYGPWGDCGHADGLPFPHIVIDDRRAAGDLPVRDLNFDLKRLQKAHDDGSHGTRTARSYALAQMADTLHQLGFKGLRATGLRRKHAVALVNEWKRPGALHRHDEEQDRAPALVGDADRSVVGVCCGA